MVSVNKKCEMIGCKRAAYRAVLIAPGTAVKFCNEHFAEET